jgi:CubicO group peptidase (beta-lactamase class C family)
MPHPPKTELQSRIASLLRKLVEEKKERGIQAAVWHRGKLVVDAWAGVADPSTGREVDGETLFPVFSVTKGIAATVVHRLAERGLLDYEMKIADAWPGFGCRGKEAITLHHAMEHTAGIPALPPGLGFRELCDWKAMCRALEGLEPRWAPGQHVCYHALNYGWLIGEVACRVTGRTFPQLVREEVSGPLGTDSLFIGMPDEAEARVAPLEFVGKELPDPKAEEPNAVPAWIWPLSAIMNRPDVRRACIPGANGVVSARALAKHYAALLPGGADGVELLPPSRVRAATLWRIPPDGPGTVKEHRFANGYMVGGSNPLYGTRPTAFGHGGYGGAIGFADPEHAFALGITKNLFNAADTVPGIVNAVRDGLGIPA